MSGDAPFLGGFQDQVEKYLKSVCLCACAVRVVRVHVSVCVALTDLNIFVSRSRATWNGCQVAAPAPALTQWAT